MTPVGPERSAPVGLDAKTGRSRSAVPCVSLAVGMLLGFASGRLLGEPAYGWLGMGLVLQRRISGPTSHAPPP